MTTKASDKIIRIPADLDWMTLPKQGLEKPVWQEKKCRAARRSVRSYSCKVMASKNAAESRSIR
jgi:hypothetical protein